MKKSLMIVAGLLLLVSMGLIAEEKASQNKPEQKKQMTMDEFVQEFNKGLSADRELFDKYFSDNFFTTNPEPFREIETVRKAMNEMLRNSMGQRFENLFSDWYNERMTSTDFGVTTENKKNNVIMKIQIPGLVSNNVNIDISDKRIKIDGSYSRAKEVRDEKNVVISRSQEFKSFSKIMSLPANVTSENSQIKIDKDLITITFQKIAKK